MRYSLAYLIGTAALVSAAPVLEKGLDVPSIVRSSPFFERIIISNSKFRTSYPSIICPITM